MSIVLRNVERTFISGETKVRAVRGVSLDIMEHDITVILGPSGSGKSTLMNMIGGIDQIDAGEMIIDNQNLSKLNPRELTEYRRDKIGFIFQSYNLIPTLTARENVELVRELGENPLSTDELLKAVKMEDHAEQFPYQLSGGQQQRIAIARALVKNPKILLCDEPTGALDESTGKAILSLLQDINKKYKTTILIITHNLGIGEMANQVVKVKSGNIAESYRNNDLIPAGEVSWI